MIKGVLLDLDGVIYNDSKPITGADETVAWLKEQFIPFRFITNTTMKSRQTLAEKLASMNIQTKPENIFSAASAAADFLRAKKKNRAMLLLLEDAKKEYRGIPQDEQNVDYVVVGDMGDAFTIPLLNKAFNCLMQGAQLIALQKNRFWLSDEGYRMDAGAFVALLEYASNQSSVLIGKPSAEFYRLALKSLGLKPEEALMVGDDVESDIAGAAAIGIKTCLMKTGKFREQDLARSAVKPDWILPGIADLPKLLQDVGINR